MLRSFTGCCGHHSANFPIVFRPHSSTGEYHRHLGEDDTQEDDKQNPGNGGKPYSQPSQNGDCFSCDHGLGQFQEDKQGDEDNGGEQPYIQPRITTAEDDLVVAHGGEGAHGRGRE